MRPLIPEVNKGLVRPSLSLMTGVIRHSAPGYTGTDTREPEESELYTEMTPAGDSPTRCPGDPHGVTRRQPVRSSQHEGLREIRLSSGGRGSWSTRCSIVSRRSQRIDNGRGAKPRHPDTGGGVMMVSARTPAGPRGDARSPSEAGRRHRAARASTVQAVTLRGRSGQRRGTGSGLGRGRKRR